MKKVTVQSGQSLASNSFHYHRRQNYSLVLATIKEHSPLSRPEIARITGLSHPTVCTIVEELRQKNLVRFRKVNNSGVGRPPLEVEFQKDIGFIVGIDVGLESYGLVADLNGKPIRQQRFSLSKNKFSLQQLDDFVKQLLDISGKQRLLGIAVAISGLVTSQGEYFCLQNNQKFPVKKELEERFGVPTIVENDANIMMLAEVRAGVARGAENAIYILKTTSGIGFGLLINGSIYRGRQGYAGENMNLIPEVVTSRDSSPSQEFITGLRRLVYLFDPEVIILGGSLVGLGKSFLEKVRKSLPDRKFPGAGVRVEASRLGRESIVLEVVHQGIARLFGLE